MPKFIVRTFIEHELEASNAEEAKQLFLEELESETNLSLASTIAEKTSAYPIVKCGSCGQEFEDPDDVGMCPVCYIDAGHVQPEAYSGFDAVE
ncbi:MAG: hypothetical protein EOL98_15390 [Negativicutes bacterium]|nr:hypothetical protein [Negativicutes bacterium]